MPIQMLCRATGPEHGRGSCTVICCQLRRQLSATGSFVPGVAYRMDESGTRIQDDATRAAEEEQTAGLLEIDEENWRRSGLRFEGSGPDQSAET
jgi:hypothetical protein